MFIMVDFFYYYLEQEINMPTFGNTLAMEYIRVSALDKPHISYLGNRTSTQIAKEADYAVLMISLQINLYTTLHT